jgi:hypothetical protein
MLTEEFIPQKKSRLTGIFEFIEVEQKTPKSLASGMNAKNF